MLSGRAADTPADELSVLTGIRTGPTTRPQDRVLARLLPDFTTEDADLAAGLRSAARAGADRGQGRGRVGWCWTRCPADGGKIELTPEQADAWLAALNDVRLALGTALDVSEDMPDELPPDDPRAAAPGRLPLADVRAGRAGADPDADQVTTLTRVAGRAGPAAAPGPVRVRDRAAGRPGAGRRRWPRSSRTRAARWCCPRTRRARLGRGRRVPVRVDHAAGELAAGRGRAAGPGDVGAGRARDQREPGVGGAPRPPLRPVRPGRRRAGRAARAERAGGRGRCRSGSTSWTTIRPGSTATWCGASCRPRRTGRAGAPAPTSRPSWTGPGGWSGPTGARPGRWSGSPARCPTGCRSATSPTCSCWPGPGRRPRGGPGRGDHRDPRAALGAVHRRRARPLRAVRLRRARRHLHGPAGPVQPVVQPHRGGRPEPQHVVGAQHALVSTATRGGDWPGRRAAAAGSPVSRPSGMRRPGFGPYAGRRAGDPSRSRGRDRGARPPGPPGRGVRRHRRPGSDRPERFIPMLNARGRRRLEFDSGDLLRLYRDMDSRDEVPVVVYHSHTATEACVAHRHLLRLRARGALHVCLRVRLRRPAAALPGHGLPRRGAGGDLPLAHRDRGLPVAHRHRATPQEPEAHYVLVSTRSAGAASCGRSGSWTAWSRRKKSGRGDLHVRAHRRGRRPRLSPEPLRPHRSDPHRSGAPPWPSPCPSPPSCAPTPAARRPSRPRAAPSPR